MSPISYDDPQLVQLLIQLRESCELPKQHHSDKTSDFIHSVIAYLVLNIIDLATDLPSEEAIRSIQ